MVSLLYLLCYKYTTRCNPLASVCVLRKVKARANERNAKLALAFHGECGRGSIARSAVKGESGELKAFFLFLCSFAKKK
jgi:hypothetical protein